MSAMVPASGPGDDELDDMVVAYWDSGTYVLQTGLGQLICASDTVIEVER